MQRVRRAAAVAVVALTGGLMLTGCQSQPSVAAYVGNTRISVDQVNKIVDEYDATSKANQQGGIADVGFGNARQSVLGALIMREVTKRYAGDQNLPAPAVDIDGAAQDVGQPASSPYAQLVAETRAYFNLVASRSSEIQPSDADLHGIYDKVPHGTVSYDQAKPQIEQIQGLGAALGVRNDIEKILSQYHVVVNPQYRGTEIGLLSQQLADGSTVELVTIPLSTAADDGDFISS